MSNRLTANLSATTGNQIKALKEVAGSYNAAFEYLLSLRNTNYKTGKPFAELVAMELVYKNGAVYNYDIRKTRNTRRKTGERRTERGDKFFITTVVYCPLSKFEFLFELLLYPYYPYYPYYPRYPQFVVSLVRP